ncbi:NAD(P)-dependent oxidoreductase [Rhodothermus marinus]|uniref:6-phosphogluconate dehydrogenase NAD-binding protein n=1 Tax=Rhodothermus marinus (strain ATCC 43812 / DSM 4252 / R-10) TaxID=518766 RepID=D0MDV6_RHOM4|nr:NAD(P)-dependent oxidoreductase [Rhodothermus marinus]ACY49100.1 6-phosphogluconate dehydrogenase NAD-binding protein [Rhodothermus marinus DSM 4252]
MSAVAVIGLGRMGQPIACNLLKAGYEVVVYNRTPEKAEALVSEGARLASTPGEAARTTGLVLTMVADDAALEAVVEGPDGLLAHLPAGGIHVAMSTISPELSASLTRRHQERGQFFVGAPVFGRPDAAAAARLRIVAAGPTEAIERCRPVLEVLGSQLFVVGAEPAQAHLVKLAGNFLLASMLEALSEAFALTRKAGLDPQQFFEIIDALFGSPIYHAYGQLIASQRYTPPGFTIRLGLKDVRLARQAAHALQVPMPLASLVENHLIEALAAGLQEVDWAALAEIAARHAGLPPASA